MCCGQWVVGITLVTESFALFKYLKKYWKSHCCNICILFTRHQVLITVFLCNPQMYILASVKFNIKKNLSLFT
jgi:hypothetical protein